MTPELAQLQADLEAGQVADDLADLLGGGLEPPEGYDELEVWLSAVCHDDPQVLAVVELVGRREGGRFEAAVAVGHRLTPVAAELPVADDDRERLRRWIDGPAVAHVRGRLTQLDPATLRQTVASVHLQAALWFRRPAMPHLARAHAALLGDELLATHVVALGDGWDGTFGQLDAAARQLAGPE